MESSSSTSSSAVAEAVAAPVYPLEPEIQYEPDTKPAYALSAAQSSSSSPQRPESSTIVAKAPSDNSLQSGAAGLVYAACPICYDRFPDCVLIPCGHTFCLACSKSLSLCSICRQPIEKWYRFFLSQGEPDVDE
jgi:hypothetical protein